MVDEIDRPLRVHNWDRWQSYRGDRGQPPWIKVHRQLLRHVAWVELTDAQRGQLVAMWLLAADHNGGLPSSAEVIQRLCHMEAPPDLNLFIEKGFLDAVSASGRRRDGVNMAPQKQRQKQKQRQNRKTLMSGTPPDAAPLTLIPDAPVAKSTDRGLREQAIKILDFLNERTGRNYRPVRANLDLITARLREGHAPGDLRAMVIRRVRAWGEDPKMREYLRPATLFNATKCAQYLGDVPL